MQSGANRDDPTPCVHRYPRATVLRPVRFGFGQPVGDPVQRKPRGFRLGRHTSHRGNRAVPARGHLVRPHYLRGMSGLPLGAVRMRGKVREQLDPAPIIIADPFGGAMNSRLPTRRVGFGQQRAPRRAGTHPSPVAAVPAKRETEIRGRAHGRRDPRAHRVRDPQSRRRTAVPAPPTAGHRIVNRQSPVTRELLPRSFGLVRHMG